MAGVARRQCGALEEFVSVVLMYHALFEDGRSASIDAVDRPYAVSRSAFARQLDELAPGKIGLFDQTRESSPEIVITFDDGHASNLAIAAPMLLERELQAYFFITTDFIGQRPGFLGETELAELSRGPGLCIGSHGVSHRFFDDMSPSEARLELEQSRDQLTALTGSACCSLSFPGGRFNQQYISLLRQAGYRQWFGSELGIADGSTFDQDDKSPIDDRWLLSRQCKDRPVDRVAIRRGTQLPEFRRIISQEPAYFRRKKQISRVKSSVRRVLGNRLYHGLYKYVSRR